MKVKSNFKMPRRTQMAAAVASAMALCSVSSLASVAIVKGVVGGAYFKPPVFADTTAASSPAISAGSVYAGATVCFDLNGNGVCDSGEPYTTTSSTGSFQLSNSTLAPLVAQISTSTLNNGNPVAAPSVFRVNVAQIQAATKNPLLAATVNITPLTTEVALAIENQGLTFNQAVSNLAQRIGVVTSSDVLLPPTQITNSPDQAAVLSEAVIAQGRLQLASSFVANGTTIGQLRGNFDCPNVVAFDPTNADGCTGTDTQTVTIPAAQNWAYNLEGMPTYDNVFVIIEENESQSSVIGNAKAPYINSLLTAGGTFYEYYSTGDPSEPNYLALGGADDWGQTSDEGLPYPSVTGVRANLWNSIDAAGLTWRTYEGSLWPSAAGSQSNIVGATTWNQATGGLWFDNPAESSIAGLAVSGYTSTSYGSALRAVKHNPAVWYADAASQPDFALNSRSVSGALASPDVNGNSIPYTYAATNPGTGINSYGVAGAWDASLQTYANNNGITSWWTGNTQPWNQNQFLTDLQTGNVGNFNFIVPDQDDDMHNNGVGARPDYWVENIVKKIESSALWNNPMKRVAIVVTFDEGESATTACCGWNPERSGDTAAQPVSYSGSTFVNVPGVTGNEAYNGATYSSTYKNGNHGHGVTVFGVYNNQQAMGLVPGGNYDTDYYSHFSFVRTLQDIFGLANPALPQTYMNRSAYTENFINQYATVVPEFAGSANPHFDSVRAMNHVYQFPAGVTHVVASGGTTPPTTVGPDPSTVNLWATQP